MTRAMMESVCHVAVSCLVAPNKDTASQRAFISVEFWVLIRGMIGNLTVKHLIVPSAIAMVPSQTFLVS